MPNRDLMVRVAWMYYHNNLTHSQIAQKLHLSRIKVTRLLQQAREQGIVEIRVTQPMPPDLELSQALEDTFGLQQAIVVPFGTLDAVGQSTAELLLYLLKPGLQIGFGWSSTVSHMASYMNRPNKPIPITVVDLIGSMLGQLNPYSVSGLVADTLQSTFLPLAVPFVVSSAKVRDTLLAEASIATTLDVARHSDVAFVGVGEVERTSTLVEIGVLSPSKIDDLKSAGAVGEILMRYFDINGQPIQTDVDDRIIGLSWKELQQIANVILVANGVHKIKALAGALRSGIPSTLITGMPTAKALLTFIGASAAEG